MTQQRPLRTDKSRNALGGQFGRTNEVVVGSRKIIMLVGSILIGALAGFALLNYVQTVEEEAKSDAIPAKVWVVTEDIEAGTSAADVERRGSIKQV